MLKSKKRIIRKTYEWLHRDKSKYTAKVPENRKEVRRIRLIGQGVLLEDGSLGGIGDFIAKSGKYEILLRIHGKNLISGLEFFKKQDEVGANVFQGVIGDRRYCRADSNYNGNIIFDSSRLKFKEKTQYTFTTSIHFTTKPLQSYLWYPGLRIAYTDGTYDDITYTQYTAKIVRNCWVTDKNKTIDAIVYFLNPSWSRVGFYSTFSDFGIFEGAFSDFEANFEAYTETLLTLTLDQPLRSIGYAADEADLLNGIIYRKIFTATIDGSANVEPCEDEGIFKIELPKPMREISDFICNLPKKTYEELIQGSSGIAPSDDGLCVFIRPESGVLTAEEFIAELDTQSISLTYVLLNTEKEILDTKLPEWEKTMVIDVCTQNAPRRLYTEYV